LRDAGCAIERAGDLPADRCRRVGVVAEIGSFQNRGFESVCPFWGIVGTRYCDKTWDMKLTAVFEPANEGGYTCFIEEIPAAISQGETRAEAKANLLDALKLVLQCQRELVEETLSPRALRESIEFSDP
jgi:predicted RNase H-like HicB family nuclease